MARFMMDYWKYVGVGAVTMGVVTTATAYFMSQGVRRKTTIIDLDNQSITLPGPERIHMSTLCKDGELVEYIYEDARTLYEAFKRGARISNNGPALGFRPTHTDPYVWISYNKVLKRAEHFGSGLILLGAVPGNDTHIGIYSKNNPEYIIAEQACYMYSMAIVPLYDTLGPDAASYIINQADVSIVLCDTTERAHKFLDNLQQHQKLETIIMTGILDEELKRKARTCLIHIYSFNNIEVNGKVSPIEINPCTPDDTAAICYTSGTTGLPKGVILTHKGIISTVAACTLIMGRLTSAILICLTPQKLYLWRASFEISSNDTIISYLPLAHAYERLCEVYIYTHGARIGFFHGDVKTLMDDMAELKPTLFPCVPRLLNRFYDKVKKGVNVSIWKRALFGLASAQKRHDLKAGLFGVKSLLDTIAFKRVQAALGGNVRLMPCGSAPLSEAVLDFSRVVTDSYVVEGYGQTESSAIAAVQCPGDLSSGQVGPPLPCNMIKLVDIPDMGYMSADDKGEVCLKGPNIFTEYLKNPEKTNEVLDQDGWLHTGDIGCWMPNGSLKIIDRKKNLFKLAQGEYIAPEKIENVYTTCEVIAQIYVHGESLQHCLVGIVVPDPDVLCAWCEEHLQLNGDTNALIRYPEVKEAILIELTKVGMKAGIHSFEQVKAIHLTNEMFSVENNLLTPTFKSRRRELCARYRKQISLLYRELAE